MASKRYAPADEQTVASRVRARRVTESSPVHRVTPASPAPSPSHSSSPTPAAGMQRPVNRLQDIHTSADNSVGSDGPLPQLNIQGYLAEVTEAPDPPATQVMGVPAYSLPTPVHCGLAVTSTPTSTVPHPVVPYQGHQAGGNELVQHSNFERPGEVSHLPPELPAVVFARKYSREKVFEARDRMQVLDYQEEYRQVMIKLKSFIFVLISSILCSESYNSSHLIQLMAQGWWSIAVPFLTISSL